MGGFPVRKAQHRLRRAERGPTEKAAIIFSLSAKVIAAAPGAGKETRRRAHPSAAAGRYGKPKYCTLGGLCWLSPRAFVVSDLCKTDVANRRCRKRDQSIHVFRIPTRRRR